MKLYVVAFGSAILGSLVSLTLVGQAQTAKTPSAVGYVSANRLLAETTKGRAQAGRIQTLQQQRANEFRTKQQALNDTRRQLTTADAAARGDLLQKESQQRAELEQSAQQSQAELQNMQREINTEMQRTIKAALDEVMKTQPYQLVVNSDSGVLWGSADLDLTQAVVGRMNAQP